MIEEDSIEDVIDAVHGAISTLGDMQVDAVAVKATEAGISMDSSKWTEEDCKTVMGFVKEAAGAV